MHFGQWLYKLGMKNHGIYRGTLAYKLKPEGMSTSEIEEVMHAQEVDFLPQSYREYLETMGKQTILFQGEDAAYGALLRMKKASILVLDDNKPEEDFRSTFVFLSHQWHSFALFFTDEKSEDPQIYWRSDDGEVHDGRNGFYASGYTLRQFFLYEARPIGYQERYYDPPEEETE